MVLVTAERQQAFARDGYFVVSGLLPESELGRASAELSAIVRRYPDVPEELVQLEPVVARGEYTPESLELGVRKIFRMAKYSEIFREIAMHPSLVEISTALLGPDVKLLQSMMQIKPPRCGSEKGWHQDNAYFGLAPCDVVGFWIAIDESTVENGCMHVVPGSHHRGLIPHQMANDLILPDDAVDPAQVVVLPMRPGDGLVFSALLFHYTPPNRSDRRRRALQLHYAAAHCRNTRSGTPFVAEMQIAGRSFAGAI